MASKYRQPKLTPEKGALLKGGHFDFLVSSAADWVRVDQAALALRGNAKCRSYVYRLINEGKLETKGPDDREKRRVLISRRSLLLRLAVEYDGDPTEFAGGARGGGDQASLGRAGAADQIPRGGARVSEQQRKFKAGDRVNFMCVTRRGTKINVAEKSGVIVAVEKYGAIVRMGNGRRDGVRFDRMRTVDQKGPVTEFFENFGRAVVEGATA